MKSLSTFILINSLWVTLAFGQGVNIIGGGTGLATEPLTDQEQYITDNFYHDDLASEIVRQECLESGKKNSAACKDEKVSVAGGADFAIEAVAKMYGLFAGASIFKSYTQNPNPADVKKDSKEWEHNYCDMIPAATETVGFTYSSIQHKEIKEPLAFVDSEGKEIIKSRQKEALSGLKRSHETRATTAKIQVAGWGSATSCYAYGIMSKGIPIGEGNRMNLVKLAATVGLTSYYAMKLKKSKEYAKIVQGIINKLPGAGDCNPVTEKNCYCAQEVTKNDPKYCLSKILSDRQREGSQVVSCVNNALEADPKCNCLASNTCFDKTFKDITSIGGLGNLSITGLTPHAAQIFRGQLGSGDLGAFGNQQNAFAKKLLNKNLDKIKNLGKKPLDKKQLLQAKVLQKLGLPHRLAREIASNSLNKTSNKFLSQAKNAPFKPENYLKNDKSFVNVIKFKKGNIKLGNEEKKKSNPYFAFKKNLGTKNSSNNSINIMKFVDRAQRRADINHSDDRQIFDIISVRYKKSGWKHFKDHLY